MAFLDILAAAGIPTAVTGLMVWWLKRYIDKQGKKAAEQEKNKEQFMLKIMQNTRANSVLSVAIAKAIERIPDAHCNGDMHEALKVMEEVEKDEKDFLMEMGVKHIFDE